jgi:hypothetical protein
MNDAFLMGSVEPVGNLDSVVDQLAKPFGCVSSCSRFDPFTERHALQKLHDDEGLSLVIAQLIDRANVRVIEGGGGPGFALKAFEGSRLAGQLSGQKLDGHTSGKFQVLALIHQSHASAAEKPDQPVMGYPLTRQRIALVRRRRGFGGWNCP